MYVNPDSVVDTTGRYRETSPEWFRANPAQTHRLVPWLNRELNALLEDPQRTNYSVTQEILELITVSLIDDLILFSKSNSLTITLRVLIYLTFVMYF